MQSEERPITKKELIEVRKDEMQSILPNHITYVDDVCIRSRKLSFGREKK